MPVVWQPPLAPTLLGHPASWGPGDSSSCDPGLARPGVVPASATLGRLQPAKLAVYEMHLAGAGLDQIAAQRRVQPDTVMGYLAEAISAGYAYSWEALGVPAPALQRVAAVADGLLGRQLRDAPPQASSSSSHGSASSAPGLGAAAGSAGGGATAGYHPGNVPASGTSGPAAAAGQQQPEDLLQQLLDAGCTVRQLKEEHWDDISYGHIRLALAHLGRCNAAGCGA